METISFGDMFFEHTSKSLGPVQCPKVLLLLAFTLCTLICPTCQTNDPKRNMVHIFATHHCHKRNEKRKEEKKKKHIGTLHRRECELYLHLSNCISINMFKYKKELSNSHNIVRTLWIREYPFVYEI